MSKLDSESPRTAPGDGVPHPARVRARVVRRRGRRRVEVRLDVDVVTTARVRLERHQETLAALAPRRCDPGPTAVRLAVPRAVRAGPATVVVALRDRSGAVSTHRESVRVPAR